jgi:uncharacterized protein
MRNLSRPIFGLILVCLPWLVFAETGQGLLWRIHKPKQPASYLFGTIHVDDKRVKNFSSQVRKRFEESKTLCLEILPDRQTQVSIGLAMMLPENQYLDAIIGEPLFAELSVWLNKKGISPLQATRLKPWAAMVMLSRPESNGGYALDEQLYHWAEHEYKQLCALETLQEQLSVFDSLSTPEQVVLIQDTLTHMAELPSMNETLIQAYINGDLEKIYAYSMEFNQSSDTELADKLRMHLIDDRNRRMLSRMLPYLERGKVFIAVGALHLPGENGLIRLLQQEGYIVSPPEVVVSPL